jgi:putative nucleotidyltransferase with HDIG domain
LRHRSIAQGLPPDEKGQPGRPLTADERQHLLAGKTLLALGPQNGQGRDIYMAAITRADDNDAVLWGLVPTGALWKSGFEAVRGQTTGLCIAEARNNLPLMCDAPPPVEAQQRLGDIRGGGRIALASWSEAGSTRYAASWNVFLRFAFGTEDWRVIISEPGDTMFASIRSFTLTFAGISACALLLVFFLSHSQIRRSTEPLEQLQAGTQRLVAGDFNTQVRLESDDEYAGLADSFNRMAQTLNRQLVTLRGLDALNQAVLGAREVEPVLEAAMLRLTSVAPDAAIMLVVDQGNPGKLRGFLQRLGHLSSIEVQVTEEDRQEWLSQREPLALPRGMRRGYLPAETTADPDSLTWILPLIEKGDLLGFVAVTSKAAHPIEADRLDAIRRLGDRLTLALADVQHVRHLAALSAGTLTAFARAIDANSPWTAGHSERVTAVSLVIGEGMGLTTDELETLRCGGLLHDIGKIGVPPEILNKAAPLTMKEREVIQRHPGLGAEILAPIGAFTAAIPIVRSHHEKLDGTGYPDGLAGDDIPYLARVLAVADVFDALVSDRPYRAGLEVSNAVMIIHNGVGTHFDPRPVEAFLKAVRDGSVDRILANETSGTRLARVVQASRNAVEDAA